MYFPDTKYIEKYGFGEGSAIMTRLVGTFAVGFAVTLVIALLTSNRGSLVVVSIWFCAGMHWRWSLLPNHP